MNNACVCAAIDLTLARREARATPCRFCNALITMSDRNSRFLGKKFACPGCQSQLKFRRPPTSLLQTCPHCRRKIRLAEKTAAASKDDQLRQAIESLVAWKAPDKQPYDYRRDPRLDQVDSSCPGIWKFDQPWPKNIKQAIVERVEVLFNPDDTDGTVKSRQLLLEGAYRRVTVFRTGVVEQIEVTGHWWDFEHHESKLGVLPRAVVRDLNRNPLAKRFAARINCLQQATHENREVLELFIDLAIDDSSERLPRTRVR